MIRRTEQVLRKILPPKNEIILFLKPSDAQFEVYNEYIKMIYKNYLNYESNKISDTLPVISVLRKIMFHPQFYQLPGQGKEPIIWKIKNQVKRVPK